MLFIFSFKGFIFSYDTNFIIIVSLKYFMLPNSKLFNVASPRILVINHWIFIIIIKKLSEAYQLESVGHNNLAFSKSARPLWHSGAPRSVIGSWHTSQVKLHSLTNECSPSSGSRNALERF